MTVCEAEAPDGEARQVYFPNASPAYEKPYLWVPELKGGMPVDSIVTFGDSGCRGQWPKEKWKRQACVPAQWPFASIAAEAAAGEDGSPDLVIHLGDYMYRDYESWAIWYEEFFKPAQPLLEVAPWVMVPGNHEACSWPKNPGSNGWFLLLDHEMASRPRACLGQDPAFLPPSAVDLRELRLILLDSANAYMAPLKSDKSKEQDLKNKHQREAQRRRYGYMFGEVRSLAAGNKEAWLLSHIPVWGFTGLEEPPAPDTSTLPVSSKPESQMLMSTSSSTLREAKNISLVLSGDLHFLQYLTTDEGPAQLIVGTGGIKLDWIPHEGKPPPPDKGLPVERPCALPTEETAVPGEQRFVAVEAPGQASAGASGDSASTCKGRTWKAHGYLLANKTRDGWSLKFHSPTQPARQAKVDFTLSGRSLTCVGCDTGSAADDGGPADPSTSTAQ